MSLDCRILVRLLREGRSVREAAGATAGAAPHAWRMVGKLLLLLRVMLGEASIGGEALLLLIRLLLLLQVVLALLRHHPSGKRLLWVFGVEEDPLVLRGPSGVGVGPLLLLRLLPRVRPSPGRVDVGRGRGRVQLRLLRRRRITGS